ncbi:MAG: hypothetical protein PF961_06200 [Planctomycetota bacterium]|jgi:uncharacterized BrkB/YihY/UPF0761 family membrane protein|nr:hypothetical protein [Planctomycetota bacterium]
MLDFVLVLAVAVTIVVHLLCTLAVWLDADKLVKAQQELWPFGRTLWILTVLLTGLIGATCYWVVHMSRITRVDRLAIAPDDAPPRPARRGDDAMLNADLLKIQQKHAKDAD